MATNAYNLSGTFWLHSLVQSIMGPYAHTIAYYLSTYDYFFVLFSIPVAFLVGLYFQARLKSDEELAALVANKSLREQCTGAVRHYKEEWRTRDFIALVRLNCHYIQGRQHVDAAEEQWFDPQEKNPATHVSWGPYPRESLLRDLPAVEDKATLLELNNMGILTGSLRTGGDKLEFRSDYGVSQTQKWWQTKERGVFEFVVVGVGNGWDERNEFLRLLKQNTRYLVTILLCGQDPNARPVDVDENSAGKLHLSDIAGSNNEGSGLWDAPYVVGASHAMSLALPFLKDRVMVPAKGLPEALAGTQQELSPRDWFPNFEADDWFFDADYGSLKTGFEMVALVRIENKHYRAERLDEVVHGMARAAGVRRELGSEVVDGFERY